MKKLSNTEAKLKKSAAYKKTFISILKFKYSQLALVIKI